MFLRIIKRFYFQYSRVRARVMRWRFCRWIKFWRQFYRMRKLGVPVMTLRMARRAGIRDIYHLNKGVGDGLMFAGVAREYYKKTGVRPLLYVPQWYIFRYCDFCYFLWDWHMQPENVCGAEHTMHAFYAFYGAQLAGKPLQLRDGYTFNLKPLEYLKSAYVWGNIFTKLYGGFPKRGQICQWIANRMDITGEIDVRPEIRLTEFEKDFGKFATGKIVIKCGGNGPYKYLTHKIAQGIVDELKGEYEFVQVGDFGDPIINGAENLFKLNLREFAGVMYHARMFVGAIGGMMHLARAVNCPAVILHGCEHDEFYFKSQRKVFSENRCMLCAQNCWWPDKDDERRCSNKYRCINDFNIKRIANIIRAEMRRPRELAAIPDTVKCVGHIVDCNSAMNWWLTLDDFITDFEPPTTSDEIRINALENTFDYTTVMPLPNTYAINPVLNNNVNVRIGRAITNISMSQEIISDNPFIIRLKPRPSYYAYIAKIADMQKKWTIDWHNKEPIDDSAYWKNESHPKDEYATLEGYARANHMMNYFLWHTEDIARRTDVDTAVIADAKHKIDNYNQLRNDFAEKMDETMLLILAPQLPGALKAPLNTESLGAIIDKLSILALKMYHMDEATKKRAVREKCKKKLEVLRTQRIDLLESTKFLLADYLQGAKRPKSYYQMKMYNDPQLNPQLSK